jgi:alpha-N-arabinofuranosidase
MEFTPENPQDEAGLCILYDNEHHFELAVLMKDTSPVLILRKNVADIKIISDMIFLPPSEYRNHRIYLEISATPTQYFFNYSFNGELYYNLGNTYTKHLSTEATSSDFIGVYCGMYAKAGKDLFISNAYFDWFSYVEY